MISDKEKQIRDSLTNKEYRDALAIEHVNTTLAIQIRKMREKNNWNQTDLAERLGKHQETISQWENPDYGKYSITSLKQLASSFDVALLVKFISFDELAEDMVNLSETRLSPTSFNEEKHIPIMGIFDANAEDFGLALFFKSLPSTATMDAYDNEPKKEDVAYAVK